MGPLEHVLEPETAPHLPMDKFHPESMESVAVPAARGDMIFFNYQTIHWSDCNRTDSWRKSVRFGYHSTAMRPVGRAEDNPHRIDPGNILERSSNIIVAGFRENEEEPAAS